MGGQDDLCDLRIQTEHEAAEWSEQEPWEISFTTEASL